MQQFQKETLEIYNSLARVTFFKGLSKQSLWLVADLAMIVIFRKDEVIIREETPPRGVFVISKGSALAFKEPDKKIAMLKEGDVLGEIAVIDNGNTTLSVKALEDTECIFISTWDFQAQVRSHPQLALDLLEVLAGRIRALVGKV